MKKFALNPPCPRAPLAPRQVADPTSLKHGEDYPDEWAKRQAKLARQAREAVRKFNEDSAAAAAEASVKPKKSMARSLRTSLVLHLQCPHGQFLTLLLILQSPQMLRPNPQHLCILPRAKGLHASLLPLELQLVPQLLQIPQHDPLC